MRTRAPEHLRPDLSGQRDPDASLDTRQAAARFVALVKEDFDRSGTMIGASWRDGVLVVVATKQAAMLLDDALRKHKLAVPKGSPA